MFRRFLTVVFLVKISLISGRFVKIQPLPERLSPPKEDDTVKFKMIASLKESAANTTKNRNETQDQGRLFTENVFDDLLRMMILRSAFSTWNSGMFKEAPTDGKMDLNTGENLRYFGNHFSDGYGGGGGFGGTQLMSSVPYMFGGGDYGGGGAGNPMMSSLFLMGTLAFVTFLINSILGLVGKLRLPLFGTRNGIDSADENRIFRLFESDPRNSKALLEMEQKIKEAIAQQEEKNMKMQK